MPHRLGRAAAGEQLRILKSRARTPRWQVPSHPPKGDRSPFARRNKAAGPILSKRQLACRSERLITLSVGLATAGKERRRVQGSPACSQDKKQSILMSVSDLTMVTGGCKIESHPGLLSYSKIEGII